MKKFFKNKTNVIIVSVIAVCLVIIGIVAFVFLGGGKQITVPDFNGKTATEVETWAKENGIADDKLDIEYIYSENVPAGQVVYQSPYANEKLLSNLVVYISLGADPNADITIPEVTSNLTLTDVKSWAEKHGMTNVTVQYVYVEGATENKVLKILDENLNEIKGTCKRDTVLYVVVACGTNPEDIVLEMPNLVGMSLSDVKKWGTAAMISIKYNYEYSDTVEAGKVISQSVAAGTKVKGGSSIQLTISVGKGVTIADLTNKTKDEAQKYCDDNYLKVAFKETSSDKIEKGKVISTDPKAGTLVKYNTVLTVYISTGKQSEVVVPDDMLGMKEKKFVEKINDLGLKVAKQDLTFFSTTLPKGTIFSYDSGKFPVGSVIKYALSAGSFFEYLDDTGCKDYNGITKHDAERLMDVHNLRNAHGSISFTKEATTKVPAGQTYNCKARMDSGIAVSVTCMVAENSTAKIMPKSHYDWVYRNELQGRTMTEYIYETHYAFKNLKVVYEYNTQLSEGQVLRIEVNDKDVTNDIGDEGKEYSTDSKVVFVLATSITQ